MRWLRVLQLVQVLSLAQREGLIKVRIFAAAMVVLRGVAERRECFKHTAL